MFEVSRGRMVGDEQSVITDKFELVEADSAMDLAAVVITVGWEVVYADDSLVVAEWGQLRWIQIARTDPFVA